MATTPEPEAPVVPPAAPKENKDINNININLLTGVPDSADVTTARSIAITTRTSSRLPSTAKSSTTLRRVKVTTSEPAVTQQTTAKSPPIIVPNPTYKILEPDYSSTQSTGALAPGGGGGNKGVVIGAVVGSLLGIALIVGIILLVIFMRKRKKRHQQKDIMQVENPRYQPISDRKRGEFRFSESEKKGGAIYASPSKAKNNNRDSDIEVLATRSSTRKKRQAPPPPNPFGGGDDDGEFTGDRRASRDPDLSPGPVELSTFSPRSGALHEEEAEPTADKPLLSKDSNPSNGSIPKEETSNRSNPFADDAEDEDSGVDKDANDDDDNIDKLVAEHQAKSSPKTPEDYDRTKNPFA